MNARSMICASAIALAGGLSVSAPAHAALTLIVVGGGGGGAGAEAARAAEVVISESGNERRQRRRRGRDWVDLEARGARRPAVARAGWLSNGGSGFGGVGAA